MLPFRGWKKQQKIFNKGKVTKKLSKVLKMNYNPIDKNLAFIFLVAGKDKGCSRAEKVLTDSRGCYFRDGTLMSDCKSYGIDEKHVVQTIPAYLLVVDFSKLNLGFVWKC